MFEQSHKLLGEDERAVFERLGPFSGFTAEAARAVCGPVVDTSADFTAVLTPAGGYVPPRRKRPGGQDLIISDLQANVVRLVAQASCSAPGPCPYGLASTTAGDIYTIAGTGTAGDTGDGSAATSAELNSPRGVAVTSAGDLYIANYGNSAIRKVTSAGTISTVTLPAGVTFKGPIALALSPDGLSTLYISDSSNDEIRALTLGTGAVSTVAGTGSAGYSGDGGAAVDAQMFDPDGITLDSSGDIFIADVLNSAVREVASSSPANSSMTAGDIYTVAGTGTAGYSGDGGNASAAGLRGPSGVAVGATSADLYIADTWNHVLRQVTAIATNTTFSKSDPTPTVSYSNAVLADSPTAYYRLGEPPGSKAAVNSAPGSDGTGQGTYTTNAALGASGALPSDSDTAVSGNGSGAVMTASDAALPMGSSDRTIRAVVQPGVLQHLLLASVVAQLRRRRCLRHVPDPRCYERQQDSHRQHRHSGRVRLQHLDRWRQPLRRQLAPCGPGLVRRRHHPGQRDRDAVPGRLEPGDQVASRHPPVLR